MASVVMATLDVLGKPVMQTNGDAVRILCIGLGGGSLPTFFAAAMPHCIIDVAELEPAVVRAAHEGMGFVYEGEQIRVAVEDGIVFAQKRLEVCNDWVDGIYDAVLVDAYDPDGNVP